MTPYRVSEQQTRYSLIDPQLKRAGWNLTDRTQIGLEIPVAGYNVIASEAKQSGSRYKSEIASSFTPLTPRNDLGSEGITDYCLYRTNGEVLAVVEAKRTSREPRVGKQQVLEYVTTIEKKQSFRPFAFMANGEDIFFWDSAESAERHVAGFFSRENLERLLFLKQNRKPLNSIQIKDSIVNRAYQIEAIRRISEAIEKKKKRKALLVMATGTGKTRTTMALIDVFLRAHAAQRVLFLADRDALVDQALADGFKVHLPNEAQTRIRTYQIDTTKRMYVSTLQTLEMCYEKFSPADFDLVIADECHRSIYNKFTDVLAYFDAIQIGLTATPAEFIDRDTMKFFDCDPAEKGGTGVRTPTYLYTFDEAVKDKYLADFNVYAAQTKFQRKGIKGVDLTDEDRDSLKSRGIDPDDINYEGTDLERKVTNKDTLRRQWNEFMQFCIKDATGQLPGKTIVFAITHNHATRLADAFNEMYPEYGGKLVQVITSKMERANMRVDFGFGIAEGRRPNPQSTIRPPKSRYKPVNSQIKWRRAPWRQRRSFWQMIGRGTRSQEACKRLEWLPNREKDKFLIVDFWENFEHFNMMPKDGETTGQIPVLVTIFNTRLTKLEVLFAADESLRSAYAPNVIASGAKQSHSEPSVTARSEATKQSLFSDERIVPPSRIPLMSGIPESGTSSLRSGTRNDSVAEDVRRIIQDLRALIARIPESSYSVKLAMKEVREAWPARLGEGAEGRSGGDDDFWRYITASKIEFLRMKVAPLLRFVPHVKPAEEFFVSKMERCGLALLQKKDLKMHIESIREDVSLLQTNLDQVQPHVKLIDTVLGSAYWSTLTLGPLDEAKETLAPLMKYRRDRPSIVIELGLDDIIDSRRWVILRKDSQRVYVEEYKKKIEEKILQMAAKHETIEKLKKGVGVGVEDLVKLEETLEAELGTDELSLDDENMLKAFGVRVGSLVDFLKHVLGLEALPSYETVVRKAFDAFILEHNYNADQSRFLRVVQSVFLQRRKLELSDLYEEPFTNFGANAVEKLFGENEITELIELARRLAA